VEPAYSQLISSKGLVVLVAMHDGSQQILRNEEEGDIYLAQTVITMTVTRYQPWVEVTDIDMQI